MRKGKNGPDPPRTSPNYEIRQHLVCGLAPIQKVELEGRNEVNHGLCMHGNMNIKPYKAYATE